MARSGRFGATLRPFGGGTLNLDAAYAIEPLTATPSAPTPGAPPPIQYGGGATQAVAVQQVPTVGTTPVPPAVLAEPVALQPWQPTPGRAADTLQAQRASAALEAQRASAALMAPTYVASSWPGITYYKPKSP